MSAHRRDDIFEAFLRFRERGLSWGRIAMMLAYDDAESAYKTYKRMRRRRGL